MHLVVQFHQELAPHHHKRAGEQQGYQQVVSDQQLRPSGAPQARAHAHPPAERVDGEGVRQQVVGAGGGVMFNLLLGDRLG